MTVRLQAIVIWHNYGDSNLSSGKSDLTQGSTPMKATMQLLQRHKRQPVTFTDAQRAEQNIIISNNTIGRHFKPSYTETHSGLSFTRPGWAYTVTYSTVIQAWQHCHYQNNSKCDVNYTKAFFIDFQVVWLIVHLNRVAYLVEWSICIHVTLW